MIPRKYASGASKRKTQQKHEDFKNKLPKLTNFFPAETKTGDTIVNESDDKIQQISVLLLITQHLLLVMNKVLRMLSFVMNTQMTIMI